MRKVRVSFYRPQDLTIELDEEQYAAAMNEDTWEDFYNLMELELEQHLISYTEIDDIRDI